MIIILTFIPLVATSTPKKRTNQNLVGQLECSKIGLYDPKSGRCFLGPNDKVITEFIEMERRLKAATRWVSKWNHGRSKSELDTIEYYNKGN